MCFWPALPRPGAGGTGSYLGPPQVPTPLQKQGPSYFYPVGSLPALSLEQKVLPGL